ncbi:MAG TPA: histidine kinase dimerization/phospho-acceptor domain-containing protein, partial [Treponemataceae bacterium]|nr:histidine kinase dimerization/phospho-acceptor domain-containing protein [Treponemataceae bacterium]
MILVLLALLISAVVFQLARQDQYLCSETALSNCPVFLGQALVYFVLSVSLLLSVSYLVRRIGAVSCEHERKFRLYELVFKTIDAGIIVLDRSGIVQFINPLCMKILGGDPTRFAQGIHFSGLIEPVLVPVYDKITAALENRDSFTREYRVFMSDGIRCYLCSFYTSFVGEQEPAYIISLSDRTREDEIRQKLSEQLEETHRYAVSKDNFFANMSHEIRTPINAILGMTYFAKMGSGDQKTQEYIQKIENASELLLGVVNDILDFSKMQEHKFSLKPENFNLFDLKKILYDLFSLKARQKGLDFNVEFDCQDPFIVFGD